MWYNRNIPIKNLTKGEHFTYYKGMYHFYNIDTWNCYKSINAEEIDNHSAYRFETCGDYIFVFDDNYDKLLNTISIM